VLAGIISRHLSVSKGVGQFIFAVLGGAVLGSALGYAASRLTRTIDDPEVQITLTAMARTEIGSVAEIIAPKSNAVSTGRPVVQWTR